MTVNLSALAGAGQQFFDNNGIPLAGGKLYSYAAGTSTPQATYTSASGSIALSNPIILDSAGRVPTGEIWLTAGSNYKFALYTSANVLITTWDNITGINGTGIASNAINVQYDPAGTYAVSTTVQTKLRETVSVKDFGATGNGTTDDSTAINLAVDYLNGINGGKLFFPAGTYRLAAAQIKLRSNIEYVGAGMGNTTILLSSSGSYYPSGFSNYPTSTAYSRIVISDMTIDGNYSSTADGGDDNFQIGIYSTIINDSIYERLEFKNMWYAGLENYNNSNRNIVSNCRFTNVGDKHTTLSPTGYYYCVGNDFSTTETKIINNQFTNCGAGVNLYGDGGSVNGCVISGNQFLNMTTHCIYGRQGVQNLIVANNTARTIGDTFMTLYDDAGILHNGGNTFNVTVSNNVISNVNTLSASGVFAIAITAQYGLSITGNTITGANNLSGTTGGITISISSIYTGFGAIISGNNLYGKFNGYEAIRNNGVTDALISNNIINGNSVATGITIVAGSLRTTVSGNQFFNCATNLVNSEPTSIINGITQTYAVTWSTSSSPQPVVGNGSLTGRYVRNGNIVHVNIYFVMGSTTTFGTNTWFFSLPFPPASGISFYNGSASMLDAGVADYIGVVRADSTNGIRVLTSSQPSGTLNPTTPFTWGATDTLSIQLSYEV